MPRKIQPYIGQSGQPCGNCVKAGGRCKTHMVQAAPAPEEWKLRTPQDVAALLEKAVNGLLAAEISATAANALAALAKQAAAHLSTDGGGEVVAYELTGGFATEDDVRRAAEAHGIIPRTHEVPAAPPTPAADEDTG